MSDPSEDDVDALPLSTRCIPKAPSLTSALKKSLTFSRCVKERGDEGEEGFGSLTGGDSPLPVRSISSDHHVPLFGRSNSSDHNAPLSGLSNSSDHLVPLSGLSNSFTMDVTSSTELSNVVAPIDVESPVDPASQPRLGARKRARRVCERETDTTEPNVRREKQRLVRKTQQAWLVGEVTRLAEEVRRLTDEIAEIRNCVGQPLSDAVAAESSHLATKQLSVCGSNTTSTAAKPSLVALKQLAMSRGSNRLNTTVLKDQATSVTFQRPSAALSRRRPASSEDMSSDDDVYVGVSARRMSLRSNKSSKEAIVAKPTRTQTVHETKKTTEEKTRQVCNLCNKLFKDRWYLQYHMYLHTGELPYKCQVCATVYLRQDLYKLHLLTHSAS